MTSDKKVIVIGIGGCSRSGKSLLSFHLFSHFQIENKHQFVEQDKFFKKKKPFCKKLGCSNWECPEAVDFESCLNELKSAIEMMDKEVSCSEGRPKYIIINGFLLYSYEPIVQLLDKKIFISLPKQEAFNRRMETKTVPIDYFDELLWPGFLKYNQHVLRVNNMGNEDNKSEMNCIGEDVLFINGKRDPKEITKMALEYIEACNDQNVRQILDRDDHNEILKIFNDGNVKVDTRAFYTSIGEDPPDSPTQIPPEAPTRASSSTTTITSTNVSNSCDLQ